MGDVTDSRQERLFAETPGSVSPPEPGLYLGTSGWSYADWEGTLYPEGIPAGSRLAEYARAHSGERLWRAHVLVAEDNQVNQKVAVRMLERLGYRADVAANGLEAMEALSRIPYAAVLMDVQMPEMGGYEATAEIRRREGSERHTPIIAMTANAMQGDREKALEAGMDDYVPKPVKPEDLEAVLERWISKADEDKATVPEAGDGSASRENSEEDPLDRDPLDRDPLDWSVLAGLRELQEEGEPDILNELIELFLTDVPPQLIALKAALGCATRARCFPLYSKAMN